MIDIDKHLGQLTRRLTQIDEARRHLRTEIAQLKAVKARTERATLSVHYFPRSGVAIAAIHEDGQPVRIGVSFTSPGDQFMRRKGRMIAVGRAQKLRVRRRKRQDSAIVSHERLLAAIREARGHEPALPALKQDSRRVPVTPADIACVRHIIGQLFESV